MSESAQIPFNVMPTEPSLTDALNLLRKDVFLNLNAHHIGVIQSFNATNQTAVVQIVYPKTFFTLDPETGLYSPVLVNYPLLVDCPAIVLGGGAAALTFPIAKGDECFLLFNDRDIDNWFQGGAGAAVATPRLHSVSDAVALVGLRSMANVIASYDPARAVLRNGQAMVGVGATLVKIANNATTLNTLLQSLITNIQNLVTAAEAITVTGVTAGGGVSGVPANAAAIAAVGTALTSLASQIGGLLE